MPMASSWCRSSRCARAKPALVLINEFRAASGQKMPIRTRMAERKSWEGEIRLSRSAAATPHQLFRIDGGGRCFRRTANARARVVGGRVRDRVQPCGAVPARATSGSQTEFAKPRRERPARPIFRLLRASPRHAPRRGLNPIPIARRSTESTRAGSTRCGGAHREGRSTDRRRQVGNARRRASTSSSPCAPSRRSAPSSAPRLPDRAAKRILQRRYAPVCSMAVYDGDPDLFVVGHRKCVTREELLDGRKVRGVIGRFTKAGRQAERDGSGISEASSRVCLRGESRHEGRKEKAVLAARPRLLPASRPAQHHTLW
jgi:hypothetical protein